MTDLAALQSVIEALSNVASLGDIEGFLSLAAEWTVRHLELEACSILKWDADSGTLRVWIDRTPADSSVAFSTDFQVNLAALQITKDILLGAGSAQLSLSDENLAEDVCNFMEAFRFKKLLLLPLVVDEKTVGIVHMMDTRQARTFGETEIALAEMLIAHMGLAIDRANILDEAEKRTAELEALHQASLSLTASLDLPEVLDAILISVMGLIPGSQDAHIYLYEDEVLRFGAVLWADGRTGTPFSEPRQDGLTYSVARTGEAIVVMDSHTHPLYKNAPNDWTAVMGSIVGLPLKIGPRVVGVMNLANEHTNAFSEDDLRIFRLLGDQAAIAIENARLHNLVINQARTDLITGLFNRRALDQRLQEEVQRSRRYERPFSLIMMDLDQFKQVNDTYGHPVGDDVLFQIAECIKEVVRDTDFLARFGGDEFALILPETDKEMGTQLAHRVKQAVGGYTLKLPDQHKMKLTVSQGLAIFPDHAQSGTALLVAADQALYRAKHEFPGNVVCASKE
jgi:diguanylate cyclase (GGDEF)-like protein